MKGLPPREVSEPSACRRQFLRAAGALIGSSVVGAGCRTLGSPQQEPQAHLEPIRTSPPPPTGNAELDELRRLAVIAPLPELVELHPLFLMLRDRHYRDDEVLWQGVGRLAMAAIGEERLPLRRQIAGLTAASIDHGDPPPALGLQGLLPPLRRNAR